MDAEEEVEAEESQVKVRMLRKQVAEKLQLGACYVPEGRVGSRYPTRLALVVW